METIGKRLERLLERGGKSKRQVALAVGISPSHLNELVSEVKDLNKLAVEDFMSLCTELSVTPEFLLYGVGEEMPDKRSSIEAQLLLLFRSIPADKQETVLSMIRGIMADSRKQILA